MKKVFSLLTLAALFWGNVALANDYVEGEGRFYAGDDDSLAFVKGQLISNAFHDVISKELLKMGLDADLFWNKWNSRFDSYFNPVQEELRGKYKLDDQGNGAQKSDYQKALRVKKLELQARFGGLARVVSSYSIKRMTRSTQVPNSRYMSMQAKVDRRALNTIYFDFVRDGESRHFPTLYLTGRFTLEGGSWTDLGVSLKKDFTSVVMGHWQKWVEENFKDKISNVIISDENIEEQLQEALKQPLNTTLQLAHIAEGESAPSDTAETNSLWLQIDIKLKKVDEDQLLSNRTFQIEGSSLLLDMKFHRPLSAGEYAVTTQTYSTTDLNAMSSALASYIYRQPLSDLKDVPRELSRMSSGERIAQIVIEGAPHIGVAQSLMGMIVDKGLAQRLSATLKETNPELTGFYLNFNGESEKLFSLLRSFHNTDFGGKFIVTLPDEKNPFHLKVIKKVAAEPGEAAANTL